MTCIIHKIYLTHWDPSNTHTHTGPTQPIHGGLHCKRALNFGGCQIQRNSLMRINYDKACQRVKIIIIKTILHSKQIVSFSFRIRDWEKPVTSNMHDCNWCMLGIKYNALKKAPFGFLSISFRTLKVKMKLLIITFYKLKQTMHKCHKC